MAAVAGQALCGGRAPAASAAAAARSFAAPKAAGSLAEAALSAGIAAVVAGTDCPLWEVAVVGMLKRLKLLVLGQVRPGGSSVGWTFVAAATAGMTIRWLSVAEAVVGSAAVVAAVVVVPAASARVLDSGI